MPSLIGDGKGCASASAMGPLQGNLQRAETEMKTVGDDHFAACHFAGELTF